jgi:hypothetical protein
MLAIRFTLLLAVPALAAAQAAAPANTPWQMQDSGTTAGLRGIDSVDGTVAWASGTGGTVLRTIDGGGHWTKCAVPDAAKDGATLDFRGVQAWDAKTAIVMASGPGDKSRLYKTTDGCRKWKLMLKNHDKDGFWDAFILYKKPYSEGWLLGEPVNGKFSVFVTSDRGKFWDKLPNPSLRVTPQTRSAFAASNSSILSSESAGPFVTGGTGGAFSYAIEDEWVCCDCSDDGARQVFKEKKWIARQIPVGENTSSSGAFSVAVKTREAGVPFGERIYVVVGGEYAKPNESNHSAAWSIDSGKSWFSSTTPPHGFRSAVQWSEPLNLWITVGPNGSDISRDDGKTWQPLDDGNWNALSLPFVVGPNGRIARINPIAFPAPAVTKGISPARNSAEAR